MKIEKLRKQNEMSKARRNRKKVSAPKQIRLPSPSAKDQVYRGPTFDIVYNFPA